MDAVHQSHSFITFPGSVCCFYSLRFNIAIELLYAHKPRKISKQ
uniref:Uncharacterized protein n=1 Tax=Arundo donax TaxID=35708 RepID=A0A0A9AA01_ARUDO